MNTIFAILVIALIVGVPLVLLMHFARGNPVEQQRKLIEQILKRHASKDFDPNVAILVCERDQFGGESAAYFLADRIYKRPDGEYFLFICEAGQPGYLTHLTRERAMNALRSNPEVYEKEFPRSS